MTRSSSTKGAKPRRKSRAKGAGATAVPVTSTTSQTTLREIARASGVGIATASRALSGASAIRPETRDRVVSVARELHFRPSRSARILRGAPSKLIGVVVPDLAHSLYADLLRGAGQEAHSRGYVLLVVDGQNSADVMRMQTARFFEERVDGLLLAGDVPAWEELGRFIDAGIPVSPALVRRGRRIVAATPVLSDQQEGVVREAFEHLFQLGHRYVGFLARSRREGGLIHPQQQRIEVLRSVAAAAKPGRLQIVEAESFDEAVAVVHRVAQERDAPTAWIAGGQIFTPALLLALGQLGVRIPDDVSVLGFGDSPWERAYRPPISVVCRDYRAAGEARVRQLIARIEKWPVIPEAVVRDELALRGSTGPVLRPRSVRAGRATARNA